MPPPPGSTIRHATLEDVPTILTLIHHLASYEHASSSVEATPETLLKTLSFAKSSPSSSSEPNPAIPTPNTHPPEQEFEPISPTRPARCLLAFSPSSIPVGFALYFHNYSTWRAAPGIYIEDLFVLEEERGKGYGKALIDALAQETTRNGGKKLEWSVLKWNEPSIRWYENVLGAKRMEEWVGMRVDGEALERLAGKEEGEEGSMEQQRDSGSGNLR